MRISDWSSDVGSSDLPGVDVVNRFRCARYQQHAAIAGDRANLRLDEVIQFAQLRWRTQTGGVEDQRVIARFAGLGIRIALQITLTRRGGSLDLRQAAVFADAKQARANAATGEHPR